MNNKNISRDNDLTLSVLSAVAEDNKATQRSLSAELGIALGLTNAYLKRAVDKGLVKIKHIPSNRYLYYLTPKGFSEKARLTGEYLISSLNFYRKARNECNEIIFYFQKNSIKNVVLSDKNELAEIFILSALDTNVKIVCLLGNNSTYLGVPVYKSLPKKLKIDAVVITSMRSVNERYKYISKFVSLNKIVVPKILKHKIENVI
jgi:DNA-binding MarR family transcriptional regulator